MKRSPYIRQHVKPPRIDDERHAKGDLSRDDSCNVRLPDDWKQRLPPLSAVFAARGFKLKKSNDRGWMHTACPWCGQRELGIHDESGRWRCRGCEKRGDAVSLVMSLDDAPFPIAIRRLLAMDVRAAPGHPGRRF